MSGLSCCCEDIDWESLSSKWRPAGPVWAGAIFGMGWWCFLDVVVMSRKENDVFPFPYYLPTIVATLAVLLLNLTNKGQLAASEGEGEGLWIRLWLLFCYLIAIGSAVGAVVVLFHCRMVAQIHPLRLYVGAGGVVQCGLILAGGLLMWTVRPTDEE